jgi:hypothetical protein
MNIVVKFYIQEDDHSNLKECETISVQDIEARSDTECEELIADDLLNAIEMCYDEAELPYDPEEENE